MKQTIKIWNCQLCKNRQLTPSRTERGLYCSKGYSTVYEGNGITNRIEKPCMNGYKLLECGDFDCTWNIEEFIDTNPSIYNKGALYREKEVK